VLKTKQNFWMPQRSKVASRQPAATVDLSVSTIRFGVAAVVEGGDYQRVGRLFSFEILIAGHDYVTLVSRWGSTIGPSPRWVCAIVKGIKGRRCKFRTKTRTSFIQESRILVGVIFRDVGSNNASGQPVSALG
jgi:hypothetical protein